jgi:hypothetical protein
MTMTRYVGNPREASGSRRLAFALAASPPSDDGDVHAPIESANRRAVGCENEETERNHPEAEDGEPAPEPAKQDEHDAEQNPHDAIPRQFKRIFA